MASHHSAVSKKSRARRKRSAESFAPPQGVLRTFERGANVMRELQDGVSVEDAIERRHQALRDLIAPFDAVHLLGQVMLGELRMDPETYKESEAQGSAYVIEMVAG